MTQNHSDMKGGELNIGYYISALYSIIVSNFKTIGQLVQMLWTSDELGNVTFSMILRDILNSAVLLKMTVC